ncbi:MAG: hypothetical protein KGL53_08940, partial [Elusimicrobia bacterium]|nr:hypothetical protein [Elusimicrobiota bacterium]
GDDHGPRGPMPLAHAKVVDESGRVVAVTAEDGSFTIPDDGRGPRAVTIGLDGIYSGVTDEDSKDPAMSARVTVAPGQTVKAVVNADGNDEETDADVNAYVYSYKLFDWFKSFLGLQDARLYTPLEGGIHANDTQMAGNAFYSPETDGFYLMRRATVKMQARGKDGQPHPVSVTFENTAQPSIILHELGHRFIQMASRILLTPEQLADAAYRYVKRPMDPVVAGDANEAFADMVSMFIRNNPIMGDGFIVNPAPGMPATIRTGENTTRYDANDPRQNSDPHTRGEILMGSGWQSRAGLIERMGPVQGALYAAMLFVRTTLYVQPGGVVSALSHALLADMAPDGSLPHGDVIRAAAAAHGVTLPEPAGVPNS